MNPCLRFTTTTRPQHFRSAKYILGRKSFSKIARISSEIFGSAKLADKELQKTISDTEVHVKITENTKCSGTQIICNYFGAFYGSLGHGGAVVAVWMSCVSAEGSRSHQDRLNAR